MLEEILEGDDPCDTIICDVNSVWPRERAIAHVDNNWRLWDATAREEAAGKSLDEVKKQLSLEGDFAFVKNMQVYKDGGDEWIRPQHEFHVRLFYLQHKNMACDVLRDALATPPRTAVADVRKLREGGSGIYFDEASINDLGHELLSASRNAEVIEVFRLNVEVFPGSADAYDNLAEAYLKIGQRESAIEHYKKSLDLNPKNENAKNRLAELDAK